MEIANAAFFQSLERICGGSARAGSSAISPSVIDGAFRIDGTVVGEERCFPISERAHEGAICRIGGTFISESGRTPERRLRCTARGCRALGGMADSGWGIAIAYER